MATPAAFDVASTALTSGLSTIVDNITGILASVLPIALGVLGIVIAIRFAIRWFRSVVG